MTDDNDLLIRYFVGKQNTLPQTVAPHWYTGCYIRTKRLNLNTPKSIEIRLYIFFYFQMCCSIEENKFKPFLINHLAIVKIKYTIQTIRKRFIIFSDIWYTYNEFHRIVFFKFNTPQEHKHKCFESKIQITIKINKKKRLKFVTERKTVLNFFYKIYSKGMEQKWLEKLHAWIPYAILKL